MKIHSAHQGYLVSFTGQNSQPNLIVLEVALLLVLWDSSFSLFSGIALLVCSLG